MSLILHCNATTYYVSNSVGDDSNSGTLPTAPWKTINKVNVFSFSPGDSILFKSDDSWREQLTPQSGNLSNSNYYGDYGSGQLPELLGSMNMSNTSDWSNLGSNIWKCNFVFSTDVGNIIFDNASSTGIKKWNQVDLLSQGDFWFDLSSSEILIYSLSNPGSIYSEIELALREDIINQSNRAFVIIENLSLKYGGAHGIGGSNTSNILINACEISFIGGGDLNMDGTIRFGNGVEFWGNASNNTVSNCKIWEIYDTGVTNQNHTATVTQTNLKYQNNVIWNCGLSSFEFWCKPASSVVSNIYFENNTCLFAGNGWGQQRPDYHGVHILVSGNSAQTDTVYLRNNIFHEAQRTIYAFADNANGQYELDYNLIYQANSNDTLFVNFPSNTLFIYADSSNYTGVTGADNNSIFSNPNFSDISNLDFSLSPNSFAIDAGTNTAIVDDIEGNLRPYNGMFDIGAYEFSEPLEIDKIDYLNSIQIYPNPAKTIFHIKFNGQFQVRNTLKISNAQGENIIILKNYSSDEGIDIEHLKNGFYWFTLTDISGDIQTGKIIVQR